MTETEPVNDLTQARLNALFELKEWQKLLIHFDLAPDTFAFIPVIVPDSSWAELCEKSLNDFLRETEKKQLHVIHLETPDELKNLAATFFDLKPKKKTGAIWISAPIPFGQTAFEEWQAAWREGMARLNQYRNPFREKFDVPVLLVGAEWIKKIVRDMAPDLWSVLTILVSIEPPAISIGEMQKAETTATEPHQFEGWRGVDPYFALQEAERLRGKKGQESGLARLLLRAANGFYARAKYRESLQISTEAAEIIKNFLDNSTEQDKKENELFYPDILNIKGIALKNLGRLNEAVAEFDKAIAIREELVNEQRRDELADDLAMAYMNKGIALWSLGRLNEAVAEYDKAIAIHEKLVNEQKREELANDLAAAYLNKGNALQNLGRVNEAVAEYDKAIAIREELVNEQKRDELANDLAMAYWGKGVALKNLGRLNEAVAEYDKAIAIYEELVNEQKRDELANDLAAAFLNKGSALLELGKFKEAVAEYDKAIAIREELVNEQKREELADGLAKTYWGKGMALVSLEKPEEAVNKYDEAIGIWYKCLAREETQILPNLFAVFYLKTDVLITLEHWKLTAENICEAFRLRKKAFDEYEISQHFKDQVQKWCDEIIQLVRNLSRKKREEIYKHAGETGGIIRQMVEAGRDE